VVGYTLLERGPRGIRLTADGEAFYPRAVKILSETTSLLAAGQGDSGAWLPRVQRLLDGGMTRSPEALLRDTERLLVGIFEGVSAPAAIANPADRALVAVNEAFCEAVRRDRGELIGGNGSPAVWSTLGVGDGFWEALGESGVARTPAGVEARRIDLSGRPVALVRLLPGGEPEFESLAA